MKSGCSFWPAALGALAVGTLGFGAVLAIYLAGTWTVAPGLWHYRSATLGDGFLLPVAVAALIHTAHRVGAGRRGLLEFTAFALVGLAGGAAVVAAWLADPDPSLNWTLPGPGRMNAAGWYHASFLVLCSGLMCGLLGVVLAGARRRRDTVTLASPGWVTALACLLGFAGCLVADDPDPGVLTASAAFLGAIVIGAVLARQPVRPLLSATGLALLGALPIWVLIPLLDEALR